MSAIDDFLAHNQTYAGKFDKADLPMPAASPYIPHKDQVRGFVYDVTNGRLDEVG